MSNWIKPANRSIKNIRKNKKARVKNLRDLSLKSKSCKDLNYKLSTNHTRIVVKSLHSKRTSTPPEILDNASESQVRTCKPSNSGPTISQDSSAEEERELEAEAIRLILSETQIAKHRAETMGAMGWRRTCVPRVDKQFARHALYNAVRHNSYKERTQKEKK